MIYYLRDLHLLSNSKIGLVQKIGFADKLSRFDPNMSPHINIVCPECEKVEDYASENFKKLWAKIVEELGFKPLGQRIDVYTYCCDCQEKLSHKSRSAHPRERVICPQEQPYSYSPY